MARSLVQSTYTAIYYSTRSDLRGWPNSALIDRLRRLLARSASGEDVWAAIDAVCDLLGRIPPPKVSGSD